MFIGKSWPKMDPEPIEHTAGPAGPVNVSQEQAGPRNERKYPTMNQFNFLAIVGKGNFANVSLAESKSDHQLYAIKILKKDLLIQNGEVKRSKIEKSILMKAREHDHPSIVRLISTFHTDTRLCFVMEYCPGGDLSHHLQRGPFDVARSR